MLLCTIVLVASLVVFLSSVFFFRDDLLPGYLNYQFSCLKMTPVKAFTRGNASVTRPVRNAARQLRYGASTQSPMHVPGNGEMRRRTSLMTRNNTVERCRWHEIITSMVSLVSDDVFMRIPDGYDVLPLADRNDLVIGKSHRCLLSSIYSVSSLMLLYLPRYILKTLMMSMNIKKAPLLLKTNLFIIKTPK